MAAAEAAPHFGAELKVGFALTGVLAAVWSNVSLRIGCLQTSQQLGTVLDITSPHVRCLGQHTANAIAVHELRY